MAKSLSHIKIFTITIFFLSATYKKCYIYVYVNIKVLLGDRYVNL